MSEVIVFISKQAIKPGKLAAYRQLYQKVAAETEANKPGTAAHLAYASQDGGQVSIVHIFPDADAMERHLIGVDTYAQQAAEFMQVVSIEIYGTPSQAVLDRMMQIAGSGVALSLKPESIGGYIRLKPAESANEF
jgi:quinol monooxygenase YgiN